MGISLEKDILKDIKKSADTEWLERNNLGYYSSSTCIGMNTRREHGLFVAPLNSRGKKVVLLSKLEESVFYNEQMVELSTNTYSERIHPEGYKHIHKFSINPYPKTTFVVENRIIEKTIFLLSNQPVLVIRYELKNKGNPVTLIVKPFVTNRLSTEVSTEQQGLNIDSYQGNKFVRWALKPGMPEVYVYHDKGEFIPSGLWFKNLKYPGDQGKYNGMQEEHLYNPGFFQVTLNSYEVFDLYVSTKSLEIEHYNYHSIYKSESDLRKENVGPFLNESEFQRIAKSLRRSAGKIDERPIISASTIENVFSTRSVIFTMPGFYLVNNKYHSFKEHYKNIIAKLQDGLLPSTLSYSSEEEFYTSADLSLWLIQLGYDYYLTSNDIEFFKEGIYDVYLNIFDYYRKGTINNIYMAKDKLIFSGDSNVSTSWIPILKDNKTILRYGKLLEVNALWYNALKILDLLGKKLGKNLKSNKFAKLANKVQENFQKVFIYDNENLYDFVNNNEKNKDYRINQIIPIALPFSPFSSEISMKILKKIDKKLLSPYGLAASDSIEKTSGPLNRNMLKYYQLSIWPWTIHFYIMARLKLSRDKRLIAARLKDYFHPLVSLINTGLIDNIPEIVTLNIKVHQEGITDFAPSLSSVLWGYFKLNKILKSEN